MSCFLILARCTGVSPPPIFRVVNRMRFGGRSAPLGHGPCSGLPHRPRACYPTGLSAETSPPMRLDGGSPLSVCGADGCPGAPCAALAVLSHKSPQSQVALSPTGTASIAAALDGASRGGAFSRSPHNASSTASLQSSSPGNSNNALKVQVLKRVHLKLYKPVSYTHLTLPTKA